MFPEKVHTKETEDHKPSGENSRIRRRPNPV
jgi:hypothetical protein